MTSAGLPVLFIGGMGRSGSTLVERVLGQTPGVCCVGELVFLWERGLLADERCGCGEVFSACPFWTEVGVRAFGGWDRIDATAMRARQRAVDRNRYIPLMRVPRAAPGYRRRMRGYAEALRRIYASASAVGGAALVVDSSKHASTAALLSQVPGISPRVAHLVRDPRGVAWSWSKHVDRPDGREPSEMARVGALRVAARWQWYNALLATTRTRGALLRYEDFVERPEHATRRLLRLGGIEVDVLPQFVDERTVVLGVDHTVAGNPMRFRTGEVEIRADESWRDAMPPSRQALTSALSFPSTLIYRYPP
ncbi:MAG: sulfotransferase [Actinomycetota bacterium]